MSAVAVTWALAQKAGGPGPKAVLIALAHHANRHTHACYPSQPLLAEELEMGVRSVRDHLHSLEHDAKLIVSTRRHRRNGSRTSNGYTLLVNLPAETAASLPANPAGSLPAKSRTKSVKKDTQPAELAGRTVSPNGDNRQNLQNLPADFAGPTTFEQSVERTTDNAAAAAELRVAGTHTCEGETPATEAAADDSGKAEALTEMQGDANEFARELEDRTERRTFKNDVRPIVKGDDWTVWRDTTGTRVPWAHRPRLLRLAFSIFAKKQRPDVRRSLQLAILQQFDPFAPATSNGAKPGSEAAGVLARGKSSRDEDQPSTAPRVGHVQKLDGTDDESIERERDARVDAWIAEHETEAQELLKTAVAEIQRTPLAKLGMIAERATRSKFRNAVLAKLEQLQEVA